MMGSRNVTIAAVLTLALGTLAASVARDARSTARSCTMVLGSEVCTWVTMEAGAVQELGATIPLSLVQAVPTDVEMVWPPEQLAVVPLPDEARRALGIDHLAINWEAHGHPPAAFLAQHFDFHFYNISRDAVRAIDCADESKPHRLPTNYALPDIDVPGLGTLVGLCVPRMGMHAMIAEEATETDAFEASMMLGYYGGAPVFFEPMVSRDLLLRKADFSLAVPPVEDLPAGVRYPSRFDAGYDEAAEGYRMVFTGFASD